MERTPEQQVEARLAGVTERRVLDASQTSLSRLLASLCRAADFNWSRIPNLCGLPTPANRRIPRSCFGGNGVEGKSASRIEAFPAGIGCG